MRDVASAGDGWAGARRRRWSASRIAAAIALHALVLAFLSLAVDRVELPRRAAERSTTLVAVILQAAPPAPRQAAPAPARARTPARTDAPASRARGAPDPARERTFEPPAITSPAPDAPTVAATMAPAASAPDLDFLDDAATRQAIRAAGRGTTLAGRGNALTHEDRGSELVAADGSHCNCKRNLPRPPPAEALAQDIAAAHKNDCMKGDFAGAGMGLLSAPFLLAAEAMGKCAHKT